MSKLEICFKQMYWPKHNFFEKVEKWKVHRMWRQVLALVQQLLINWKRLKLFQTWRNLQKKIGRTKCQTSRCFFERSISQLKMLRIFCWSFWVLNGPDLRKSIFFESVIFPDLDVFERTIEYNRIYEQYVCCFWFLFFTWPWTFC